MGADANAEIIYGFPFEGENFDFDDESYHNDPDKWLAEFQGLPKPAGSYESNGSAWKEYRTARRALPIKTAYDGDMVNGRLNTYLCIREASLGGPKIPVGHVRTAPVEWNALLKAFCEKAGVLFQQPDWYLLASYG